MADLSKLSNEELLKMAKAAPSKSSGPDLSKMSDEELLKLASNERPRPKASVGESTLVGLSQGLTGGFSDEAIGGLRGAIGKLKGEGDFGSLYEKYRDEQRNYQKQVQADNPNSYLGGSIIGAVAGPGKFVKAGTTIGKVGLAALGGGLTGAGLSESNPLKSPDQLEGFVGDVATGATVGGLAQGAFSALGNTISKLKPSSLRKTAEESAFKAAGGMTKDFRDAKKAGTLYTTGRELLDKKVVTAFSSLDDVAERAAAGKKDAGEAIGKALENVDSLVSKGKELIDQGKLFPELTGEAKKIAKDKLDETFQFNMKRIGERIKTELIDVNKDNPLLKGELQKLAALADDFGLSSAKTLKTGNVIKGTQGKLTKFESDTLPNAFKKEVYDIIKTELDDVVSKTGNLEQAISKASGNALGAADDIASRNQSASQAYSAGKKTYGALKSTEDMAKKRLGGVQSNRGISLSDTIMTAGGYAGGGTAPAVALGSLNKFVRTYGSSLKAVGADKLADTLEKSPQVLQKYIPFLENAGKRGGAALAAAHMALMKDPDYRRAIGEPQQENNAIQRRLGGQ